MCNAQRKSTYITFKSKTVAIARVHIECLWVFVRRTNAGILRIQHISLWN